MISMLVVLEPHCEEYTSLQTGLVISLGQSSRGEVIIVAKAEITCSVFTIYLICSIHIDLKKKIKDWVMKVVCALSQEVCSRYW